MAQSKDTKNNMVYNLEKVCNQARAVVIETGAFIRRERLSFDPSKVEYKSAHDLVSYVDKTAEMQLVAGLEPLVPGCGFITEEDGTRPVGEVYNWIIDPLDGTTNFIHGIPCFCISIALQRGDQVVLGIVYEINLDECFYAWEGSAAYLNEQEIRASKTSDLERALLATGFPTLDYNRLDEYMEVFKHCMKHTRGLRRLGSAAADLAYAACGRLDGFFEYALNPWDVAGGAFILQQAGGTVTDFSGGDNYVFGREIVATNSHIHPAFLAVMRMYFQEGKKA